MSAPSLAPVLALLQAHADTDLSPMEAMAVGQTMRFVTEHPDCLLRTCLKGHLTGSAWIVSPDRRMTLLTHHGKLDKWLQLGGHADGDPDLLAVAMREANEESGLTRIRPVTRALFDVDRHRIPARGDEPEHWHHDLRFMIEADPAEPLVISSESKELSWVEVAKVTSLNPEESMARMVRKTVPHR
ncbi:MAG TPA: NUDIX hydrolase [Opitutaceae bacterium]|nr:NUDIX hydrolase [Opitutaceae bacterium]